MEMERIRYVLSSYLRCRLTKVWPGAALGIEALRSAVQTSHPGGRLGWPWEGPGPEDAARAQ